jgi:hypothetical protein
VKTAEDYNYSPCRNGIHVCGHDGTETYPLTVANVEGVSAAQWDVVRAAFSLPDDEDPDLVVDFMVDGDIVEDFGIRRQSLDALLKSLKPN